MGKHQTILLGLGMPHEGDDEGGDSVSPKLKECGQEVMDALKSGDAETFTMALQKFIELRESYDGDDKGEEPDEDDGG